MLYIQILVFQEVISFKSKSGNIKLNFTSKLLNNNGYSVMTFGTRGYGLKSRNDHKFLKSNFGMPELMKPKHLENNLSKTHTK